MTESKKVARNKSSNVKPNTFVKKLLYVNYVLNNNSAHTKTNWQNMTRHKPFVDGRRLYEKLWASLRLSWPWLPGFSVPARRAGSGLARAMSWLVPDWSDSVNPSNSGSPTSPTLYSIYTFTQQTLLSFSN